MAKRGGFPGGMGGFGGMNINSLMKEAKKMQADLEKSQNELAVKTFEASAGGNAVSVKVTNRNIMSVNVPVFDFQKEGNEGNIYPYGMAFTSGELDSAMISFSDAMEPLLRLAESENSAQLLAQEIERTRRRVNALENVMIPNYQETIKYIAMKLEENERANTTRLMKVKDMVAKKAIEDRKKQDEVVCQRCLQHNA